MSDFIVLNLNKLKDDLGQNDTAPDTPLVSVYKNAHGDIVVGNTTVSLSDLPAIQGTPGYHVNGRKTPMSAPLFTMTAQQIRALPDVNNNLLNIRARFLQNQRKKSEATPPARLTKVITTIIKQKKIPSPKPQKASRPILPDAPPQPEHVFFDPIPYYKKRTDLRAKGEIDAPLISVYRTKENKIVYGLFTLHEDDKKFKNKKERSLGIVDAKLLDISVRQIDDYTIHTSRKLNQLISYLLHNDSVEKSPAGFKIFCTGKKPTFKAKKDSPAKPLPEKKAEPELPQKAEPELPRHIVFNLASFNSRKCDAKQHYRPQTRLLTVYKTTEDKVVYGTNAVPADSSMLKSKHAVDRGILAEELFDLTAKDMTEYCIHRIAKINQLINYLIETPAEKRSPMDFFMHCGGKGNYQPTVSGNKPYRQPVKRVILPAADVPKENIVLPEVRGDGITVYHSPPSWGKPLVEKLIDYKYDSDAPEIAYTLAHESGKIDPYTPKNNGRGEGTLITAIEKNFIGLRLVRLHRDFCRNDYRKTTLCLFLLNQELIDADDLLHGAYHQGKTKGGQTADDLLLLALETQKKLADRPQPK